jgi:hypothetical protein
MRERVPDLVSMRPPAALTGNLRMWSRSRLFVTNPSM